MPLVLFTGLGVAGGGIGVAALIRGALAGTLPVLSRGEGILIAAMLGVGSLISARHLGRPLRGPLALRGLGRSPLSNEILALSVALAGALLALATPEGGAVQRIFSGITGLGSVAFLLSIGVVYSLPGQLAWRGAPVAHPLVLGMAWGLLFGLGGLGGPAPPALELLFWVVLAADGVLAADRFASQERMKGKGQASHPALFGIRRSLWGSRILLSHLVAPLALALDTWTLAVVSLSLAVLVDRFAFYALAIRTTTESEVARVEALLGDSDQVLEPGS
jgi:anaerobic dimethyl sulfoxide reductase subunit C (anchor subunit)